MHLKYVYLTKKAHKIQLQNTDWHYVVVSKDTNVIQSSRAEYYFWWKTCWIKFQRLAPFSRGQLLTTVSETVSYSVVSLSIKTTLQQSVKLKWPFPCMNSLSQGEPTLCLFPANWLKWFRRTEQGELLMWGCLGLNGRHMVQSATIRQQSLALFISLFLSFLKYNNEKKRSRYNTV